jgi:hypothetical protein
MVHLEIPDRCDPDPGAIATDLFNFPTGYQHKSDFRKPMLAPVKQAERGRTWFATGRIEIMKFVCAQLKEGDDSS